MLAISPVPSPPPVRLRAEPLSHRLPLQGGVLEASTRLPVELYHSPLEGESQKPSRMAKADAVGGKAVLRTVERRQGMEPTRERGRPARTRFGTVAANSSTRVDRQQREDSVSAEAIPLPPVV